METATAGATAAATATAEGMETATAMAEGRAMAAAMEAATDGSALRNVLRSTKDEVPRLPSARRPKIIVGSMRALMLFL
jgi:hypothetical protein